MFLRDFRFSRVARVLDTLFRLHTSASRDSPADRPAGLPPAAQRPDFDAALAAVHGVHDALPLGSEMAARAPIDSLDDFAALSLRPQRR